MSVIELQSVSKAFRTASTQRVRTARQLRSILSRERHWALRDVSFDVPEGASVGIIGRNGAGKSTLLRVISGLTRPTSGRVRVDRRISGLLTLGEAFQTDLTGAENAVTQAILSGLTRRDALARLDQIAEFSELADVLQQPLRTYSDGMRLRLAFAVSINVEPEILMIDELLAVGDIRFRRRCLDRLEQLSRGGVTTLLTSHDMAQVERLCDRAVWLSDGRVRMAGATDQVLARYEESMAPAAAEGGPRDHPSRGSGEVRIVDVVVRNVGSGATSGRSVDVEIAYAADQPTPAVVFAVNIHRGDVDQAIVNATSRDDGLIDVTGEGTVRCRFDRLDLPTGEYAFSVGAYPHDWTHTFDYWWHAATLIIDDRTTDALLAPPSRWDVTQPTTPSPTG